MKITRIVKNKDGHVEATMMLTMEQVAYLINVGLLSLIQRGSLELQDMTPETFQESVQEKQDRAVEHFDVTVES